MRAQDAREVPGVPAAPEVPAGQLAPPPPESIPAGRDSLLLEIERYSQEIATLKDSLGFGGLDIQLDAAQRERLQKSISEFTGIVEDIGQELSRLDFEINENRVSLTDEFGEGIVIQIPENLDERLSEGVEALSQMILKDLPDSSSAYELTRTLNLSSLFSNRERKSERKIIQGNLVKVSDDVQITGREDLRGNLVVVMGDAEVSGRVDGDVVVVLGSLRLDKGAEVTGRAVCVLGGLDRDPDAEVGELVVVDPWPSAGGWLEGWKPGRNGVAAFALSQILFLVVFVLALIVAGVTPRERLERVLGSLRSDPLGSLGIGVLAGLGLHLVVLVLLAVLILTVIGLPLALLLGIAMGLVAALAVAVAGAAIGRSLCRVVSRDCPSFVLSVAVGLIVLHSVSLLAGLVGLVASGGAATLLMAIGFGIKMIAFFLGFGALARSQVWRRHPA